MFGDSVSFEMDLDQPIIRQTCKGLEIRVKVSPNSSRESVCFKEGESLIIKLKAPPIEGRANRDLIKIVARKLGVAPGRVTVLKGLTSREKTLLVEEVTEADAVDRLKN